MCAGRERAFPLCAGITFRLHGLFFCAAPLLRPFLRQVRGLWHKTKTSARFASVPPVLRCRRFPLFPASLSQQCACRFLGEAPCCAFRGECGQPFVALSGSLPIAVGRAAGGPHFPRRQRSPLFPFAVFGFLCRSQAVFLQKKARPPQKAARAKRLVTMIFPRKGLKRDNARPPSPGTACAPSPQALCRIRTAPAAPPRSFPVFACPSSRSLHPCTASHIKKGRPLLSAGAMRS